MAIHYRKMLNGNKTDFSLSSLSQVQLDDLLVKTCQNEVMGELQRVNPLTIGSTMKVFFDNTEAQFCFMRALLDAGANPDIMRNTDIVILSSERSAVALAIKFRLSVIVEHFVDEYAPILSLPSLSNVEEQHIPQDKREGHISVSQLLSTVGSLLTTTASEGGVDMLQVFESVMPADSMREYTGSLFLEAVIRGVQSAKAEKDATDHVDYALYLLDNYPCLIKYLELGAGTVRDISTKLRAPELLYKLNRHGYDLFEVNPAFAEYMLKEQGITPLQYLKKASDPDDVILKSAAFVYLKKNKMTPYALIDKVGNNAIEKALMGIMFDKVTV